jgi:hypothetical protein
MPPLNLSGNLKEKVMKRKLSLIAGAVLALAAASANAVVICNACAYVNGQAATNLGIHNPGTFDGSTFANSTTGQNGDFDNTWVFSVDPAGKASLDVIFLPIQNISNFAVRLFDVSSFSCGAAGSGCSALTLGGLLATSTTNPTYASVLDFFGPLKGTYAFEVTGTVSGLTEGQPASYAGNLQTVSAVPEPETFALFGAGLATLAWLQRRRQKKNQEA